MLLTTTRKKKWNPIGRKSWNLLRQWFYQYADFGPAEGDVRDYMNEMFKKKTGKELPKGYETEGAL
jgi:hypothetical protein